MINRHATETGNGKEEYVQDLERRGVLGAVLRVEPLATASNGHSIIWPEARMVIKGDTAYFYHEAKKVWSCNMTYAANNFDVRALAE